MRICVLNVPEVIQNGQLISQEYVVKYKLVLVVVVVGGATAAAVFKWLLSLWSLSTLILAKAFKTTCAWHPPAFFFGSFTSIFYMQHDITRLTVLL